MSRIEPLPTRAARAFEQTLVGWYYSPELAVEGLLPFWIWISLTTFWTCGTFGRPTRFHWGCVLAISSFAFLACDMPFPQDQLSPDKPQIAHENKRAVGAKESLRMPDAQKPGQSPTTAQEEGERQIVEDSAKLLKLATELKSEADKTTLDTLSLTIVRKADEIEKLAGSVKKRIKVLGHPANEGSVHTR